MVVGFTTTYAISAYHHWFCEFESRPGWGVQHYVIKFVSDLRQVGSFLRVLWFYSTNKTDSHDIAEILLKVALSTIKKKFIRRIIILVLVVNIPVWRSNIHAFSAYRGFSPLDQISVTMTSYQTNHFFGAKIIIDRTLSSGMLTITEFND